MSHYIDYYSSQVGGRGIPQIYVGAPYQKGHGIGTFLGGLFRSRKKRMIQFTSNRGMLHLVRRNTLKIREKKIKKRVTAKSKKSTKNKNKTTKRRTKSRNSKITDIFGNK